VLVLAEVELISFIVARMGLCFGFVLKIVLITQRCFLLLLSSAHTASRSFLLLTLPHQRVGWGCTRIWEGTQPGQLTAAGQTDMPYDMTSYSAIKCWGKKKQGWNVQSDGICLPESPLHVMEACFAGDGWTPSC